jgi:hypothetical protein
MRHAARPDPHPEPRALDRILDRILLAQPAGAADLEPGCPDGLGQRRGRRLVGPPGALPGDGERRGREDSGALPGRIRRRSVALAGTDRAVEIALVVIGALRVPVPEARMLEDPSELLEARWHQLVPLSESGVDPSHGRRVAGPGELHHVDRDSVTGQTTAWTLASHGPRRR